MTTTRSPTTRPDPVVLVCDPGSSSLRLVLAGPGDRVVASRHVEQPPGSPAAAAAVDEFLNKVTCAVSVFTDSPTPGRWGAPGTCWVAGRMDCTSSWPTSEVARR